MSSAKAVVIKQFDDQRDKLAEITYQGDLSRIDRAKQQLVIAMGENDKLAGCTPFSLVMSVRDSLELGMDLSKKLGQAYLVPYKDNAKGVWIAQLILGYRGMIELAGRAGITIAAGIVRERDEFVWEMGTNPRCIHSPAWGDRGNPLGAYAIATLPDRRTLQERMDAGEIEAIRRSSKMGNAGPWMDFPDEMAKKTVIRRLFKTIPTTTPLLARAMELESDDIIDTTASEVQRPQGSRTDQAKARLGMKVEEPAQETEQPETATEWDDSIPF
jgi:recombination protein RecT